MTEPSYDVVWPGALSGIEHRDLAPRLDTLEGKRIGFLWDYLFRGDELFPVLERELAARYEGATLVGSETFGNTHGDCTAAPVEPLSRS